MDGRSPHSDMINDVAGADSEAAPPAPGALSGVRRLLILLRLKQPSFADKVDAYRRGTTEERRSRRQAERCRDGIERARARLQRMAARLADGGLPTTVKFWPVAYRFGTDRKDRRFGYAELRSVILVSTRRTSPSPTAALPITVTSTRQEVTIQPSFAALQESGQNNVLIDLFLEVAHGAGTHDERLFCERFEDALAQAIASGRLRL